MEWFKTITEMIGDLGWPIAIIVVVLIFKKPIKDLIERIKSLRWKDLIADTSAQMPTEIMSDDISKEVLDKAKAYIRDRVGKSVIEPASENIDVSMYDWNGKSKELYWLGHDLMYAKAVLIAGTPREQVLIGLKQAYNHMRNLGFGKECNSLVKLAAMLFLIRKNEEKFLTLRKREDYARKIQSIIYIVGELTEQYKEKFEKEQS